MYYLLWGIKSWFTYTMEKIVENASQKKPIHSYQYAKNCQLPAFQGGGLGWIYFRISLLVCISGEILLSEEHFSPHFLDRNPTKSFGHANMQWALKMIRKDRFCKKYPCIPRPRFLENDSWCNWCHFTCEHLHYQKWILRVPSSDQRYF